ncbi:MAG: hypothetical protein NTV51_07270 [Verrucomicrobia bacterium]|nr:hypothetical protein [Verrucomicrobiota bacterium]
MTQRLFLTCLSLAALLTSGCLFSKKSSKSKDDGSISSSVEESFRVRWIDKRVGELVAKGAKPEAARTQAAQEFSEKYVFSGTAQKK